MPEQQKKNSQEQIRALREKLRVFIEDLRYMYEQYKNAPDLQVEQAYLGSWFPRRIETFEKWEDRLAQAMEDAEYRTSERFYSALQAYGSLGRALEADTRWSERDEPFQAKADEMIRLSREIRKRLRERQDSNDQQSA